MTDVGFEFNDREPICIAMPAVPRVGEVVAYLGVRYLVQDVKWFVTPMSSIAEVRCVRIPGDA